MHLIQVIFKFTREPQPCSGLLVNTVTAGLIMIIRPFTTNRRPFIKDVLFYMAAVSWSAAILVRRTIYLSDSVGFIGLYLMYVVTTWAAGHVRLKRSNSQAYRRCAAFFQNLKNVLICTRNSPSTANTKEEDEKTSTARGCHQSLWRRLRGLLVVRRPVPDGATAEDLEGCSKKGDVGPDLFESSRRNDNLFSDNDIKIVGFRRRPNPICTPTASTRNGNRRSPLGFPRIEVTSPPVESSATRPPSISKTPSLHQSYLAPPRDFLDLPQRHPRLIHPLTPPHSPTLKTDRSSLQRTLTPPVTFLGHGPALGGSNSATVASSFRKRASVGGIGLRTRTPSMSQRRGSRRMSTMEQLPFIVRWIIANAEAEDRECEDGNAEVKWRYRNISDSTHTPDISSLHTFTQDHSQSRSPTVSFLDEHSSRNHMPHLPPLYHRYGGNHELKRISSVSLPDLEEIDKDAGTGFNTPTEARSRLGKEELSVKEATELSGSKIAKNEGNDEEEEEYLDPFVQWASRGMWHHLLYCLCPIDISEWKNLSIPVKILQIIQAPIFILFRLTIPVVYEDLEPTVPTPKGVEIPVNEEGGNEHTDTNVEAGLEVDVSQKHSEANDDAEEARSHPDFPLVDFEYLHGWCRLLNCFQCLLTPMLWVLLITGEGNICINLTV
ncbi:unnamed protein product [Mesocestoides corti]|uniref:Sodium/calcium exchanger membrane region domain-containing protein n=1 Tax=Mesocestoides corti TaxID=53468 RepID=A0A158QW07_MESCO|nr:unnamed protein product [Mesocestoides corti]